MISITAKVDGKWEDRVCVYVPFVLAKLAEYYDRGATECVVCVTGRAGPIYEIKDLRAYGMRKLTDLAFHLIDLDSAGGTE